MLRNKINQLLLVLALGGAVAGCSKNETAPAFPNASVGKSLAEVIEATPRLSLLAGYLKKSGLLKELEASKTYTVWAPDNEALKSLDPTIAADSAKLRAVLSNHIALFSYYSKDGGAGKRVEMLNGKQVFFAGATFDASPITEADHSTRNGVLHVIGKLAAPLPSVWEYINGNTAAYRQNAFIVGQNYQAFDPALAIVDSISANTGLPVYRPGTGLVTRNLFLDQVADVRSEEKLFTYFLVADAAMVSETNRLLPYFRTSTADSTLSLSSFRLVRDMVVEGYFTKEQISGNLVTRFGVTLPVRSADITASIRLSNGIVHVLGGINFNLAQKLPNILVQGEQPRGTFRPDGSVVNVRGSVFFRDRLNPLTGKAFNDIYVYNHGVSALNLQYTTAPLPAARYKVYWVAVNDTLRVNGTINPTAFQQRLALGSRTATNFALRAVDANNYGEVLLGEYTHPAYGPLDLFLTAASSTAAGVNTLTLDYIRLEPQL
ncbi:Uncaracterized surface protein containing fasciclin (FAS1) repeats [Cnuella takakiae]|uniref:Uncaracterized surface protein containing fasciclin (FAS1) repeats n=1 Tax=Cnuella takakiae TaxID=1302690 RepID=A0A1M4UQU4_9BACT|nr:fasciclin domain-containing protein [Cnuella takakiae]OLY92801.1 hypothetical protein BUE76_13565 [Cnuella takakiae]SHE59028.1 Uncaracterized surface protein containing fasciclin (FAS1) repeats [Cnuella takakiae]